MTKGTKRVLFYSAVAVFLILSYVIMLYAQGYKYSFSENRFFKTGAIYLKVNTDADVYLNDKLLGNTSFFGNSYRIEGLLPNKYAVRVQKDDHSSWQKLVTVEEGFVSEFSKILILLNDEAGFVELEKEITLIFPALIPIPSLPSPTPKALDSNARATKGTASPSPTSGATPKPITEKGEFIITKGTLYQNQQNEGKPLKIAGGVKGFILSSDKNKLAWWISNELWVIWLNDGNYQPYHKKGDKELITKFSAQIKKAAWFRDEDHLIVDSNGYKILEIDTRSGINIVSLNHQDNF